MLVECGYVRAQAPDGTEYTFAPSLGRVAALGTPEEIVRIYVDLHGPKAPDVAAYVLATMCEQEDPFPLIGWHGLDSQWHEGHMPPQERVIIARHLMHHGIVGKAKPDAQAKSERGSYADRFVAADYITAARVHLGLSSADAEGISMTEFQMMLDAKYPPEEKEASRDVPTREEYDAAMNYFRSRQRG